VFTAEAQAACKAGPGCLIFKITPEKVNKTHLTRMTRGVGQQRKDKGKRSDILAYLEIPDQRDDVMILPTESDRKRERRSNGVRTEPGFRGRNRRESRAKP
jgi:hypothetical protein